MRNQNSPQQDFLSANLDQINSLNQRGGRMLSIIDLIDKKTIPLSLAAYLAIYASEGCNFLTAAMPGGAGKTAVMGALMGLLPAHFEIRTIENEIYPRNMEKGREESPIAYVIHEIGQGHWYGYIWGRPVLEVIEHLDLHTKLFTNMHPDTIEDIYSTFEGFGSKQKIQIFDFIITIRLCSAEPRHRIHEVWQTNNLHHSKYDGDKFHWLIYNESDGLTKKAIENLSENYWGKYHNWMELLNTLLDERVFPIEEVAERIQESLG
jgi:hypothetical protein